VSTLVRTIFEQPDAESVRAQHAQVVQALEAKLLAAAENLDRPATTSWPSPRFPARSSGRSGRTTRRNG
jgi:transposase-like protein